MPTRPNRFPHSSIAMPILDPKRPRARILKWLLENGINTSGAACPLLFCGERLLVEDASDEVSSAWLPLVTLGVRLPGLPIAMRLKSDHESL